MHTQVWDPTLIISQILTLQCLLYLTLGVFLAILLGEKQIALLLGLRFSWTNVIFQAHLLGSFLFWMFSVGRLSPSLILLVG
jgi:hypothetical protein